ncbi:unnamed protein product [Paramecium pentaurelia]|uniref:3'-5' exonuclease domain-containing protein n=1 Tax=Paramecium pentaurelia TaxID=43138 RepID=A0A8S1TTJ1_9CILI|nr:unnamed protein product [Paramecium pentaurelia]
MEIQQILIKMFSFPLYIDHFFIIDQKNEFEWKLIQSFSQQTINHSIHEQFDRYLNIQIPPYLATQQVFKELNKVNEIIQLIIKIRKDIIYTQYKEANTNDTSSMFGTYQNLQNHLGKYFEIDMKPQYRKYQLTQYGIIDLLVFSFLHKSRSFHRVITKGIAPQISCLYSWYSEFIVAFEINNKIDPNYLPRKEKRVQIQKNKQQKSNPELIESIKENKFLVFQDLIDKGASIYTVSLRDKEKMLVPHLVCAFARINYAQYLSSKNVDWECEDDDKMTPIFYAIRSESKEMIEYLLKEKVNLEHKDIQDRTPFYYACSLGQLFIIRFLVEKGANINAKTALGRTPFSKASFLGLYNVVEFLLQQPNIDYNYADKQGRNALHNAVFGPKGGRDGRKVGTWCYDSPLIAQLLLEHGMDVEAKDKDNNTPLHVAASSEALNSIPILLAFGCDINKRNKWGETALMIAAKFNHYETANLLISNQADYFLENEGYTPMEIAAKNDQFEVFQFLLDKMRPELLQFEKVRKCKLQQVLQSLMSLTKSFKENKYIKYFLQNFQPNYDKEHVGLIIEMQDGQNELISSYLKNFIVTQEQISNSFELCLRRKNMSIFKQICLHARFEYKVCLQKSLITMLLESVELDTLLFQFNIDWFNYRSKQGETFLHKLIEKRKTETLLKILNLFQEIIDQQFYKNYKNFHIHSIAKDDIYNFLTCQNLSQSTIIEIAVIHKFMDIYQMLDNFISINYGSKQGLKFKLINYAIELDHITKLPQVFFQEEENYKFIKKFSEITSLTDKELQFFEKILKEHKNGKLHLSQFYSQIQSEKPVKVVEQEEHLKQCVSDILQNFTILGVDIEHYSDKVDEFKISFACTIQLSTVDMDYIIDIMKLRPICNKYLTPIFENQHLLKVFHGCEVDLRVLFSDLKIIVKNILDTSKIDMALIKSPNAQSLEKLCKQYLNIYLDKLYQTSDWRIRPLPQQMIEYARLDSASLLFLYPILIDECRKSNLVTKVFNQCQKLSLITQYPLVNISNKD